MQRLSLQPLPLASSPRKAHSSQSCLACLPMLLSLAAAALLLLGQVLQLGQLGQRQQQHIETAWPPGSDLGSSSSSSRAWLSSSFGLRRGGWQAQQQLQQLQQLQQPLSAAAGGPLLVPGEPEVWARGPRRGPAADALAASLPDDVRAALRALCGRCLYRTLTSYVRVHDFGRVAVVMTGDIPAMWTRDSAVQMASYLPRLQRRPGLRPVVEGAIRAQAYFVLQDPYANAYNPRFVPVRHLRKADRQLGRGGWVWTRNFELDSVAYFFNFLWNYHQTPGLYGAAALLREPLVHDAVAALLRLLVVEQRHEERSPYRYSELPRGGLGPKSNYTGMVWSGFRASDDPQKYSYNVPDNMYLWGALKRLALLNDATWRDPEVAMTCRGLLRDIHRGIQQHAVVEVAPDVAAYAYEVDGLGNYVADFDDPNLPSLLALPLLGYDVYDRAVYNTTRARILSRANPFFFDGDELQGLGSPHTDPGFVWPLATAVEALTAHSVPHQRGLLLQLLKMAHGNGLVHESVFANNVTFYTRPEFGWANAMFVVAVEQLLGVDCDAAAEEHRLAVVAAREALDQKPPPNEGADSPLYYEQLEAGVAHELTTRAPAGALEQEAQLEGEEEGGSGEGVAEVPIEQGQQQQQQSAADAEDDTLQKLARALEQLAVS